MEKNAFEKLQVQGRRRPSCIAFVQRLVLDSVANFTWYSEIPSFLNCAVFLWGWNVRKDVHLRVLFAYFVGNTESWPMFIHSTFQPLLLFLCNVGMTSTFVLRVRPSVSISILLEKPFILSSSRMKGGRRFYLNSIFMFLDPYSYS